jgi:hypothetical protein
MKKIYACVVPGLAAFALMPQMMRAQNLTLDDFSTAPGKVTATSGTHTTALAGSGIIGGTRYISIVYNKNGSPFGQSSTLQVRPSTSTKVPSALIWSNGYDASPEIQVYYGPNTLADPPLNLDLTAYNRFRLNFQGLATSLVLAALVDYGPDANIYADEFCTLPASNTPFTVDIPFSKLTPTAGTTIPWNAIGALLIELTEGSSPLNSPNLAITGYSAIPASEAPGTILCGPTT